LLAASFEKNGPVTKIIKPPYDLFIGEDTKWKK
jgi:hypothetical protein